MYFVQDGGGNKMLRLTIEREKRKLPKYKLAAAVGIHPAEIGRMESGRIKPYGAWRSKLEKFFDIPADDLFREV
jgi:ribosome-binding protein aMBF1 (putative translation factor)